MTSHRTEFDVVYRETAERDLTVDLYLPEEDGPRPVAVFVHGGGWESDHKGTFEWHLSRLAERGVAGADMTHRLSSEATFPAPVGDVKYGIRWLKSRADEYEFDPDRIAVGGHSSGAHLAALAAVSPNHRDLDPAAGPDESSAVTAAVVLNGPYDLEKLGRTDPSRVFISGFVRRLFGGPYLERPEAYRQASCLTHIDGSEPPFLILTGTIDEEVPTYESFQLREHLVHAGGRAELHVAAGGGHLCFKAGGDHYEAGMSRIEQFFDDVL